MEEERRRKKTRKIIPFHFTLLFCVHFTDERRYQLRVPVYHEQEQGAMRKREAEAKTGFFCVTSIFGAKMLFSIDF